MSAYRTSLQVRFTGNTESVVVPGPVAVQGYVANVGSSGTLTSKDAGQTGGGSTAKWVLDATAGVAKDLFGARFESGLSLQGSAAGTDVTVFYDKA